MKRIVITLYLLTLMPILALSQDNDKKVVEEILKLEQELSQAKVKDDLTVPKRLLAEDCTVTFLVPPQTFSKAALLMPNPASNNPTARTIETSTLEETKVRVFGNTAIFTGRWKETRKYADGRVTNPSGRLTDTWVKLNGRWQLVASHASPDIDLSKLRN